VPHPKTCPLDCVYIHGIYNSYLVPDFFITFPPRQVGRKERKVGPYGGCYIRGDGSVLVSRPGVRIWLADSDGNVRPARGREEGGTEGGRREGRREGGRLRIQTAV